MTIIRKTFEELAVEKMKARAERLHKLVELKAPIVIIAEAVISVVRAMETLAPMEYHRLLAEKALEKEKRDAGYCIGDGCTNMTLLATEERYCPECWEQMSDAVEEEQSAPESNVIDLSKIRESRFEDDDPDDTLTPGGDKEWEDLQTSTFACRKCKGKGTHEVVFKRERSWVCAACEADVIKELGEGARSAPFEY